MMFLSFNSNTSVAETANPSEAPEFIQDFTGARVSHFLDFRAGFCRSLIALFHFRQLHGLPFFDLRILNRRRTDNTLVKRKRTKGQTMIYTTLQKKLKIEQHEPPCKSGVNAGAPEGLALPASLVASVVLLY
jgi:hypothetical protein